MSNLILPGRVAPSNLRLAEGTRASYVEADVYDIARRLKELHPSLYAVQLEDGRNVVWAIMEDCDDGDQRLIFKVPALDGRVLKKLGPIMAIPLADRVTACERMEYKMEEDRKEEELEKLYETIGRPMLTQLEHDGFIQRPVSYPKRGVKATTEAKAA